MIQQEHGRAAFVALLRAAAPEPGLTDAGQARADRDRMVLDLHPATLPEQGGEREQAGGASS